MLAKRLIVLAFGLVALALSPMAFSGNSHLFRDQPLESQVASR